jgi:hypothetical protein
VQEQGRSKKGTPHVMTLSALTWQISQAGPEREDKVSQPLTEEEENMWYYYLTFSVFELWLISSRGQAGARRVARSYWSVRSGYVSKGVRLP